MLDFASRHASPMLITIEGIPENDEVLQNDGNTLRYISTSEEFNHQMSLCDYVPVTEGVIAGVTGAILAQGPTSSIDVGCVLAPTSASFPDGGSAAKVIKALQRAFPQLNVDTLPLEKKAETVKTLLAQQPPISPEASAMYS
eukprot:Colp12_sorted_trinity150504_noHs@10060